MSTSSRSGSELGFYAVIKEIVTNYRAVLGAIGLLLYAMVRVAHDSFYAGFGLTPEDVGLIELAILGRAALYTAWILFVVIAVAGVWFSSWFLLLAAWRKGHRGLVRRIRSVLARRRTRHDPIDRRRRFNPPRGLSQASWPRRYASHGVLSVFFFLALPIPLMVDRMAPYLTRFLLEVGTLLFSVVLCWTLLLSVVFFRAQRLAGFHHRVRSTQLCLFACSLVLAVPVVVSLLALEPPPHKARSCSTGRPYVEVVGPMRDIRSHTLERFYRDLIDCGLTNNPLRTPQRVRMEGALLAWVGALAILVYITWHQPRDRATDTGSPVGRGMTRTEGMAVVAVLAVLASVTMFATHKDGIGYANDLRLRGLAFGQGFSVFSLRASPVCVASQDNKFDLDEPVMLLGETSSRLIVFQYGKEDRRFFGNTLKLPVGGVLVRHLRGRLTDDRFAAAQKECRDFVAELLSADEDADRPAPVPATSSTR